MNFINKILTLALFSLAAMAGTPVSGTYDASLGSLPQAQGWKPASGSWGGGAPNDYVSNGTLYMNYSPMWNGYGQAYSDPNYPPLSQPFDLADGFTITFTVKVVEGRFCVYITDKIGKAFFLIVDAAGYLQFLNTATTGPSVAFNPSDALHTYLITGNANSLELRIDGATNPLLVASTYTSSDLNYVQFGDAINATYTIAQLTKFSFQMGQPSNPDCYSQDEVNQKIAAAVAAKDAIIAQKDAIIAQNISEIANLNNKINDLNTIVAAKDAEIAALKKSIANYITEIALRDQQINTLKNTVNNLNTTLAQKKQKITLLNSTIVKKDQQLAQEKAWSNTLKTFIDSLPPGIKKNRPTR
jgi:hypothetical protein